MSLRRFFIAVVVAATLLIALKSKLLSRDKAEPDIASLSDADLKNVTVRLERSRCYGSCPEYSVTIHGDGRLEYEGKSNVKDKGELTGAIEPKEIRTLLSEFARAKFLSIAEDYSDGRCDGSYCTDMSTAVTELSVKGVTHRVRHYYGCGAAPKALFALEAAIDKAGHSEQWTGDVSKQGPFGTTCFGGRPTKVGGE